jgi:hypothetical protein
MDSTLTRWKYFAAMALIGDGMMAMVRPRRDATAWVAGPRLWRNLMRGLADHPGLTRAIGGVQVAAVMYWALRRKETE